MRDAKRAKARNAMFVLFDEKVIAWAPFLAESFAKLIIQPSFRCPWYARISIRLSRYIGAGMGDFGIPNRDTERKRLVKTSVTGCPENLGDRSAMDQPTRTSGIEYVRRCT
jgi:hypothetical protein